MYAWAVALMGQMNLGGLRRRDLSRLALEAVEPALMVLQETALEQAAAERREQAGLALLGDDVAAMALWDEQPGVIAA